MHRLPGQGKLYVETSAGSGPALHSDGAAVLTHDAVCHREAQAGSFLGTLGCEKWIVNSLQMFRRNALPAVSYLDAREPVFVPSPHRQRAARFHGLALVQEKIQKHLF